MMVEADAMRGLFGLLTDGANQPVLRQPLHGKARHALLKLAVREKCHPNLLRYWEAQGGLAADELVLQRKAVDKFRSSATISEALPASAILLKGANLHRHYPAGIVRHSADVDVLVSDMATLADVHAALLHRGFDCALAGLWGLGPALDLKRAIASLRYTKVGVPTEADDSVSVEVQLGGFPLTRERSLPFNELAIDVVRLPGNAYLTLSPTRQLMLALTDFVVRQSPLSVRHLADLHNLLRAVGSEIDQDEVARAHALYQLHSGLERLHVAAVNKGLPEVVPSWLEALRRKGRSPVAVSASPPATAEHAPWRRVVARGMVGILARLPALRSGGLSAGRWSRRPALVAAMLGGGQRVYAIPLSYGGTRSPVLLRVNNAMLLANGAGLFLLSLTGSCDRETRLRVFESLRRVKAPRVIAQMKELRS